MGMYFASQATANQTTGYVQQQNNGRTNAYQITTPYVFKTIWLVSVEVYLKRYLKLMKM